MRRLFFVIVALLAYGSFYPWHFSFWGPLWPAVVRVFHAWPPILTFGILKDMALNVVVYAPLGLTGYLSSAAGFRWARALWPIAFGFAFSLTVETLQSFIPGRDPSGMDLLCNTVGAAAGVGIAMGYESAIVTGLQRINRHARRPTSALMLLIILAGHYLMPLTSDAIRLFSTYHQPVLLSQAWNWTDFLNAAVTWLLAGRFLEAVAGRRGATLPVIGSLLAAAFLMRLLSPNLLFTWPILAGSVLGVVCWRMTEGRRVDIGFAVLTFVWLVGDGLRPFTFTAQNQFDWIPFRGLMGSDWTGGVEALLNKAWMYGAAFWTWEHAGLSRARTLAALLVVLCAIEYAQQQLPGRVSTMTDPAMGLIAAGLLWAVERKYGA